MIRNRPFIEVINKEFLAALSILYLFPVFFVLHGYNENFGLIPGVALLLLLLKYFCIVTGVVTFSFITLRNISKSVVFSFLVLCFYFFFGAIHDAIKSFSVGSFWASYTFLLPFILITIVTLFFYIKRTRSQIGRLKKYISYLLIFICILELVLFVSYSISNKARRNNLANTPLKLEVKENCTIKQKPDIFFIVLDGYTSSECLREEFGFDNSGLDSLLINNGFFISKKSRSNYNVTPFSLSSTLNFNYLKAGIERTAITSKQFIQAIETLKHTQIVDFLKKEGYSIKNYGCFDLHEAKAQTKPYFDDFYYEQIGNQTIDSRSMRDIGWFFNTRNIFTGDFRVSDNLKKNKQYHLFRNTYNLNGLIQELKVESDKPKFVYVHLMLPHEPFYLDSNGREVPDSSIFLNLLDLKSGYLNQVVYSNKLLKSVLPLISKTSINRVVIIEGDHGYRFYDSVSKMKKEFLNLNAYFFADKNYNMLYNGISPVNSFRVILNKYFCRKLPLLKDTSFYINQDLGPL